MKHHTIITGTGRAGTTFLIELLTKLGLNTGFTPETIKKHWHKKAKAGLELGEKAFSPNKDLPEIIKSPFFLKKYINYVEKTNIKIDHIFIPVRDFSQVSESRIKQVKNNPYIQPDKVTGGLVWTNSRSKQEEVLKDVFTEFIVNISKYNIPITFINFPELTKNAFYLYKKLLPIISHIGLNEFKKVFNNTVNTEFVHKY